MGLATFSAHDANNVRQLRMNLRFLPYLSNCRICGRFARLDDAPWQCPHVGVTVMHKQDAALLVSDNDNDGRHQDEVCTNLLA